jgi:hypothetical protein
MGDRQTGERLSDAKVAEKKVIKMQSSLMISAKSGEKKWVE